MADRQPTGAPIPYPPPPKIFAGIDPSQKRTGQQANAYLQSVWGKPLTAEQQQAGAAHIGYTDQTGNSEMSGDQFNKLLEFAAQNAGQGYGYQPWLAEQPGGPTPRGQQPYPTTGPLSPAPIDAPAVTPAPAYNAPVYQQERFTGPTAADMAADPGYQFRLKQGTGAIEASAAARGTLRSGQTMRDLASYGQDLASQEYGNVYNRATQNYGINQGERQFGFNAQTAGAQAEYAPNLVTWNAQRETGQRNAELNFDRGWQRELYGRDDAYRRERDVRNDTTRDREYNTDDAWRRFVLEEERRRFLATQGNQ